MGTEGLGLSPVQERAFTRQLANPIGITCTGRCTATTLAVGGIEHPGITIVRSMLRNLFKLHPAVDRLPSRLRGAWLEASNRVMSVDHYGGTLGIWWFVCVGRSLP